MGTLLSKEGSNNTEIASRMWQAKKKLLQNKSDGLQRNQMKQCFEKLTQEDHSFNRICKYQVTCFGHEKMRETITPCDNWHDQRKTLQRKAEKKSGYMKDRDEGKFMITHAQEQGT